MRASGFTQEPRVVWPGGFYENRAKSSCVGGFAYAGGEAGLSGIRPAGSPPASFFFSCICENASYNSEVSIFHMLA